VLPDSHPIRLLQEVVRTWPESFPKNAHSVGEDFEFHRYSYVPGQELGTEPLRLSNHQVLDGTLEKLIEAESPGRDISVRSRASALLMYGGWGTLDRVYSHLPMIDFHAEPEKVLRWLPSRWEAAGLASWYPLDDLRLYRSGRSCHGYGVKMIPDDRFSLWMAGLLLLNMPAPNQPLTDTRWIGHRLNSGFAALRLTKNQPCYLAMPQRLETPWN
jgi:hypothetical protein